MERPASSPRVLCIGAAVWDVIFRVEAIPTAPATVLADDCVEVASGMATSAALAVAALGGRARLLAAVGDDPTGRRYLSEVDHRGVDVTAVHRLRGAETALATILVDPQGAHLACSHYSPRLAEAIPAGMSDEIERCDAVLCDLRWPDAAEAALLAAHRAGRINVLAVDIAPAPVQERLVPAATHVVFDLDALTAFTGQSDAEGALRRLGEQGVARFGCLGVTLGEDGFLALIDGRFLHRAPPPPPSPVVDTLAAGDVFHGAFTLRLAEGGALEEAVDFALATATLKCTHFGGNRGTPTRHAVEAFLTQLHRTREL